MEMDMDMEIDMETTNYKGSFRTVRAPLTPRRLVCGSVYIVISCVLVNSCSAVLCGPVPVCTPHLGPFAPVWSAFAAFSLAGGPTPPCTSFPISPLGKKRERAQ